MPLFSRRVSFVRKCLGVNMSAQDCAHTLTHSEVERTGHLQIDTHRFHNFTETWHLRERSCPCSRRQVGSNPALSNLGRARKVLLHRKKVDSISIISVPQFSGPAVHDHFLEPEPWAPRVWLVRSHWAQISCTTASPLLLAACCTCWTRTVARECSCFTAIR